MEPKNNSVFIIKVKKYIQSYASPWSIHVGRGHGSGFCMLINKKKYIITNYHVVRDGIYVSVGDINSDMESRVLFTDIVNDIAILDCSYTDAVPLEIGECTTGETVYLQGFPGHYHGMTVTEGIISKLTKLDINISKNLIYMADVVANPGNSGGPALNAAGKVVGMLTYGIPNPETAMAGIVPFFILNHTIGIFAAGAKIMTYSHCNFGWQILYDEMARYFGLKTTEGVIVWDKTPQHVTHIEGIKIHANGQIKLSDMLHYLGYKPISSEMITFKYLIPLINKKKIALTIGGKTIELPTTQFNLEMGPPEFTVFGGYIFVPTGLGFSVETGINVRNKVMIVYAEKNEKFQRKILDISWPDFIKTLKTAKKMMIFEVYGDNWKFFLDPADRKRTAKTLGIFSLKPRF